MADEETRSPERAIQEIRDKIARGEEPTDEERDFLESEHVRLDAEDGGDDDRRSDLVL